MIKKNLIGASLIAALMTVPATSMALDKAALLDKIRNMSSEYAEFRMLLNSPEQSVRLAAFDVMFNSGDPVLREIAVDEALAYPDVTLQSLAFRELIMGLNVITFTLKAPEGADELTKKTVEEWGYKASYRLQQKDVKNGLITTCNSSGGCIGHVTGLQLTITHNYCQLKASLGAGVVLSGMISCQKQMPMLVTTTLK